MTLKPLKRLDHVRPLHSVSATQGAFERRRIESETATGQAVGEFGVAAAQDRRTDLGALTWLRFCFGKRR